MTANALVIASIATAPFLLAAGLPFVAALGTPDAGDAPETPRGPAPDDASCSALTATPRLFWTTCATKTDFSTGNLSVAGRADVAGPLLVANDIKARGVDVIGDVSAGSAIVAGTLKASEAAVGGALHAGSLRVDDATELGVVQLRVANAPSCVEGALALVRNADGSDTLEACLRTSQGASVWTPVAMGGFVPSMSQPRAS